MAKGIMGNRGCGRIPVIPIIVAMLLVPCVPFAQAPASNPKTGTPPSWVDWPPLQPNTANKTEQGAGGQFFTLVDTQVNPATTETFVHIVKEITTDAGVRSGANLEFTWDPSFQELTIHLITIQRQTERLDRLDLSKFKVIQQESDLDRQVYNGTLSALLFLEDVRVGDRIEFAYTVRGENPSLSGRYSSSFLLGLSIPVQQRRVRVLWPEERKLNFRLHGTSVEPQVRTHDRVKEYLWELSQTPAVVVEDQIPSWFPAYPWVQLSEFKSWSEVASWASQLYVTTNLDAPELKQQIAKLRQLATTAEGRVQAALEFTQNDVRYLGIEFGPNSYHPTDPVTVLRRRFGDCKDKAFLLCTLLRGLGYEAAPVLVATGLRHTLPDLLPAPHDFDHVIVRVIAEGATFWLDPTRSYQRGPILQRDLPQYSFGLLVRPEEMQLTSIPASVGSVAETFTTEIFRVGGQKAATQLSVTTTFKGFDAEWIRAILSSGGEERLAKGYLNEYAQRYPGVMPSAPMDIEDSQNTDQVTLIHTYSITNFWVLSSDKQRYGCEFYPLGIHNWITKPATAVRSMPMELSYPRRRSVQTRIELPRAFTLSNLANTIAGPAAELRVTRAYRGQTVWLDYEYSALTNFVPVSLTAEHLHSLVEMENALGYSLNWQNMEAVGNRSLINWPIILLAVTYTVIFSVGAGFLCRRQYRLISAAAMAPPPLPDAKLSGLGGWLILVGIGRVAGPLQLMVHMTRSLSSFSPWTWQALTHSGGVSYHPAWGPLLTLELLGQITLLILDVFLLVLFFQKRRIFPSWFIALLVFNAIFILADYIGLRIVKPSSASNVDLSRTIMQAFVGCAIWIPYMRMSRRVKATFVR